MVQRTGLAPQTTSFHVRSSPQWIFELPACTRWVRLRVHCESTDPRTHRATLQTAEGVELLQHSWSGAWIDEIFLPLPANATHLTLELSQAFDVQTLECRLQPISRLQMAWIALNKKLRLLIDHGCTTRVLSRGLTMLLRGQWGEFRRKLARGVSDSRFIETDAEKNDRSAEVEAIVEPDWLKGLEIEPLPPGRRFVLLTPSLSTGDAVGNDVLGMAHVLRAAGVDTFICSRFATTAWPVVPINQLSRLLRPSDTLIYHHSIGFAEAVRLFEKLDCGKILKFHNITPPDMLREHSEDLAKACEQGLSEIPRLLAAADAVLVDSIFNSQALPADFDYEVLPPFNQIDALLAAPLDRSIADPVGILMVGRVAPNKNIESAIETLAILRREYRPDARLTIVGSVQSWEYLNALQMLAEKLDITDEVHFVGAVSLSKLHAFYKQADAYLCTSRHEGFGMPLMEALSLRTPVVAVPNGAVPATLAGCGWICPDLPQALARTLNRAMEPSDERATKLLLGERHYRKDYANKVLCRQFLEQLRKAARPLVDPLLHLDGTGSEELPEPIYRTVVS